MSTITTFTGSTPITTAGLCAELNTNFQNINTDKDEISNKSDDDSFSANSATKYPTQRATKSYVDAGGTASVTALRVLPYIYPVGALYFATVSTNPTTLLGFGTWSAYAKGRVLIGAGTETVIATFASRASNVITVTGLTNAANNEFQTGQAVVYHTTGNVITGLSNDATYYLIRTGNLTFSLASSLTNAQNGTVISLSSDGTGTQTFTLTLTARTGGDTGGEENHAMSSTELVSHTHQIIEPFNGSTNYTGITAGATYGNGQNQNLRNAINPTGGNAAMNNMQPFVSVYMWLRTA
jgi:hypothetical protein